MPHTSSYLLCIALLDNININIYLSTKTQQNENIERIELYTNRLHTDYKKVTKE